MFFAVIIGIRSKVKSYFFSIVFFRNESSSFEGDESVRHKGAVIWVVKIGFTIDLTAFTLDLSTIRIKVISQTINGL